MFTQTLFEQKTYGYITYRIPTIITLPNGRIIVFCEGRLNSFHDYGTIKVLIRISDDNGKTFSSQRIIAENGVNTVGNPTPVYDKTTGIIWLFMNGNTENGSEYEIMMNKAPRTVLVTKSLDSGESWEPFIDMTNDLKPSGWTWYAFGPCHAIQMTGGRLIIPANHSVFDIETGSSVEHHSHIIYSDDHGKTWSLGGESNNSETNECTVVELDDGRLYLNMRGYYKTDKKDICLRAIAYSADKGITWSSVEYDEKLIEPGGCQASVIGYPRSIENCQRPILFSNPAHINERKNLTIRISFDNGASWKYSKSLYLQKAAYSDLTVLPDGKIACVYECGEIDNYEKINFSIFTIEWLMEQYPEI